jgi:hypothetical protein
MNAQVHLRPQPLREVEVVGCDDAAAGKHYAEIIQLIVVLSEECGAALACKSVASCP